MSVEERVMVYLKKHSGNAVEIGEALGLTKRGRASYNWGSWNFEKAEKNGIIEWKNDKWYLRTSDELQTSDEKEDSG